MKEIESKIREQANEVEKIVSKKSKNDTALQEAAEEAEAIAEAADIADAEIAEAPAEPSKPASKRKKPDVNVIIDADDDFEEFTPVK